MFFESIIKIHLFMYIFMGWLKGTLSRLKQYLTTEIPLKMMKNVFYFILK